MFLRELFITCIEGGFLIILALVGYFFFNNNHHGKDNRTDCRNIKKVMKMHNFTIDKTNEIKKYYR